MNIFFKAFYKISGKSGFPPVPGSQVVPYWYSNFPKLIKNSKKFILDQDGNSNATVKFCVPLIDSLITGYLIRLEYDVQVIKNNDKISLSWKGGGSNLIETHDQNQIPEELVSDEFYKEVFKFSNFWSVKTPKGYSLLVVHPLNRTDLPFLTLSGIVDTDDYNLPINLPFFIKKNFEGIIPAGTPIAQLIPIKREPWRHFLQDFKEDFFEVQLAKASSIIYRSYKKIFWKRKSYK